jgi:hypothetical protein
MDPSLFMDDHGTVHRRPHIERYSNLIEIPIIALIPRMYSPQMILYSSSNTPPASPDRNRRVPGNAVSKGEAEDHTNFISRKSTRLRSGTLPGN